MVRSRLRRVLASDTGSIAPAVPIYSLAIFLLSSLVIAGSLQLNARGRAVAYAEEAARAGASAVDLTSAELKLNPDDVAARVDGYCEYLLKDASARVDTCELQDPPKGDDELTVTVHVKLTVSSGLLTMFAVKDLSAVGDGTARPYEGTQRQAGP